MKPHTDNPKCQCGAETLWTRKGRHNTEKPYIACCRCKQPPKQCTCTPK